MNVEICSLAPLPLPDGCVYDSYDFCHLNAPRADKVVNLCGTDSKGKVRIALTAGKRDGKWMAPFSAPFSSVRVKNGVNTAALTEFFNEVSHVLDAPLKLTLPPSLYNSDLQQATWYAALSAGARQMPLWLNHHFPLERMADYRTALSPSARNKFNASMRVMYDFNPRATLEDAYAVIEVNRAAHGYPLRMTLEQLRQTAAVVRIDSAVLSLDDTPVAAAIVYHVAPGVVQVIYWGDTAAPEAPHPMNRLAFELFTHYYNCGMRIVDIGPSTSPEEANPGLATFKESIGCVATLKPTLVLNPSDNITLA